MIITFSGVPGSGKTTMTKLLQEKFGGERIYIGGIMRKLANDAGMTIEDFMKHLINYPEIDNEVDLQARNEARALAKKGRRVYVEGRVQFLLLPESFKVFLDCDLNTAAERVLNSGREGEAIVSSVEEKSQQMKERLKVTSRRLNEVYGANYLDKSNYDLVLDTTNMTINEVFEKITKSIENT